MANSTKTPLITSDPLSYLVKGIKNDIDGNTLVSSTDFNIKKSPKGSQLAIHPKFKYSPNYMNYVGDWNISSSYNVNDVVNVFDVKVGDDATKSATELLEDQLTYFFRPLGFVEETFVAEDGEQIQVYRGRYTPPQVVAGEDDYIILIPKIIPTPGTYICVAPVPPLALIYDLFAAGVFTGAVLQSRSTLGLYARFNFENFVIGGVTINTGFLNINYFPHHPELPTTPHLNVNNLNTATGSYWRMLSLYGSGGDSCQCRYH